MTECHGKGSIIVRGQSPFPSALRLSFAAAQMEFELSEIIIEALTRAFSTSLSIQWESQYSMSVKFKPQVFFPTETHMWEKTGIFTY